MSLTEFLEILHYINLKIKGFGEAVKYNESIQHFRND